MRQTRNSYAGQAICPPFLPIGVTTFASVSGMRTVKFFRRWYDPDDVLSSTQLFLELEPLPAGSRPRRHAPGQHRGLLALTRGSLHWPLHARSPPKATSPSA